MQLCYDCAFKHLSDAYVAWTEVFNGYDAPDHIMKVVGNLAHAEEHLLEKHAELAGRIRQARKEFFEAKVIGAMFRPPFEALVSDVWELILIDIHTSDSKEADNG